MSPADFIKVCPRCGTVTELQAKFCVSCGRRYRTEFTPSLGTHSLLICPPALPSLRETPVIGTTVILSPHRRKALADRRIPRGLRCFWQRAKSWGKSVLGRTEGAPQKRHKKARVPSRLYKV